MNQLAVRNIDETIRVGEILAKSGFFDDVRSVSQAVAKIIAGTELGFPPMASMTGIYIVKGRVTLSANLLAAAVKQSTKYDYRIKAHTNEVCTIAFCERQDGKLTEIGESAFTVEDAQNAGLSKGDNWEKYPRNMLFARAMSNGAKWFCPDLFGSPIYTPDEFDLDVNEEGEIVEGQVISPMENHVEDNGIRNGNHEPAIQKNGNSGQWPARPWPPDVLKDAMFRKSVTNPNTVTQELFTKTHAAFSNLNVDDEKRHVVQRYLFGVESSKDMTYGQCQSIIDWIGSVPEQDEEGNTVYVPNADSIAEVSLILAQEVPQHDFLEKIA